MAYLSNDTTISRRANFSSSEWRKDCRAGICRLLEQEWKKRGPKNPGKCQNLHFSQGQKCVIGNGAQNKKINISGGGPPAKYWKSFGILYNFFKFLQNVFFFWKSRKFSRDLENLLRDLAGRARDLSAEQADLGLPQNPRALGTGGGSLPQIRRTSDVR